jgi:hypothetical protein
VLVRIALQHVHRVGERGVIPPASIDRCTRLQKADSSAYSAVNVAWSSSAWYWRSGDAVRAPHPPQAASASASRASSPLLMMEARLAAPLAKRFLNFAETRDRTALPLGTREPTPLSDQHEYVVEPGGRDPLSGVVDADVDVVDLGGRVSVYGSRSVPPPVPVEVAAGPGSRSRCGSGTKVPV